jgi:[ribosomal protein S18]-alanine N-acetyltransferase
VNRGPAAPAVRPLRSDDAPAAAALDVSDGDARTWAAVPGRPGHVALAVDLPDAPTVGVALAVAVLDEAEVHTIAVDPDHRRRGVGGVLLAGLLEALAAREVATVHLEVRADNDAALALYAAHGFVRVGLRPAYYADGTDALLLRRDLQVR